MSWGDNYTATWEVPEIEENVRVRCRLYKDNKSVLGWNCSLKNTSYILNDVILDSGDYYFTVSISPENENSLYAESDVVKSEVITYIRPENELGTTTAYWDNENPGTIIFPAVTGADSYCVYLYHMDENGEIASRHTKWRVGVSEVQDVVSVDCSSRIKSSGPGQYCVGVQALSNNIDVKASGRKGELSNVYEYDNDDNEPADNDTGGNVAGEDNNNDEPADNGAGGSVAVDDDDDDDEPADNNAGSPAVQQPLGGPIYYTIVKGDTLNGIAVKRGVRLAQILAWNPQIKNPNRIFPGQVLVVGYNNNPVEPVAMASQEGGAFYLVRKGDSLYGIARKNGVSLNTIIALNPQIATQKYIYPGQQVRCR